MRRSAAICAICVICGLAPSVRASADFPVPSPDAYLERLKLSVDPSRTRLDPYTIDVDGRRLDRGTAASVDVYPHAVVRKYAGGIVETTTPIDGVDALSVEIAAPRPARVSFALDRDGALAIATEGPRAVVAFGATRDAAQALANRLLPDARALGAERRARVARLLLDSYVETGDARFDRALAWCKVAAGDDRVVQLLTGRLDDARRRLEAYDASGAGADDAARFVRDAFDYVLHSGDLAFARRVYPAILRATDATMRARSERRTGSEVLWFAQLEAAARLAHLVSDKESSERWEDEAIRVKAAFRDLSLDLQTGSREMLVALTVPYEPLVTLAEGKTVLRRAISERRPVWNADSGALVCVLARYHREELAFELARAMVDAAGPSSDAVSAAEFVRAFYQGFLGVRLEAVAEQLAVEPTLPRALGTVRAVVPYGAGRVKLTLEPLGGGHTRCTVLGWQLAAPIEVVLGAPGPQGMIDGAWSATLKPDAVVTRDYRRPFLPPVADPGPLTFATGN